MKPIIDYTELSISAQETEYRQVRQRGESNPDKGVKVRFRMDSEVRYFVESDLWQVNDIFWLAA